MNLSKHALARSINSIENQINSISFTSVFSGELGSNSGDDENTSVETRLRNNKQLSAGAVIYWCSSAMVIPAVNKVGSELHLLMNLDCLFDDRRTTTFR